MPHYEQENASALLEKENKMATTINVEECKAKMIEESDTKVKELNEINSKLAHTINLDCVKNENEKPTDIQNFYNGKNVLVTGATGFLGKILVEKLLRSCPGLENLYLLVRQKKGKDIYTRMEEIFEDSIFGLLKKEVPKFRHKVVVIPADCGAVGLGLSLSDRQMLIEKVNIIFHSAATVKFDEHLRVALSTNVQAPLQLLQLAHDMKALHVLMHISTAYSNSHLSIVEEKFYPCDANTENLFRLVEKLNDQEVKDILPTVLGPWPNTYTFTKALAEKEIRQNVGKLPVAIFRPAIVTSTAKEPLPCWVDNMYGPTGVVVGAVTGVLRTLHCNPVVTADIVPADFVVNCLLAAAVRTFKDYTGSTPPQEPPIYNYVSSVENRITWGDFKDRNLEVAHTHPFSNALWYMSLNLTPSIFLNNFFKFFLHFLPAALVDILVVCIGRKPKMLKMYEKVHKFSSVLSYFCTKEIKFCNKRTRRLWQNTSDNDKKIFPFSMASMDWMEYFKEYLAGIRQHLFKESDDTLPSARIKWRRLYYLHQIVRILFYALTVYSLLSVFTKILR